MIYGNRVGNTYYILAELFALDIQLKSCVEHHKYFTPYMWETESVYIASVECVGYFT